MANIQPLDIGHAPAQLVAEHFGQYIRKRLTHLFVVSKQSVQSARNEIHNYVEIYFIWVVFPWCEEVIVHFNRVRMIQLHHYGKLSISIFRVLIYFFYCYTLSCPHIESLEYCPESSLPNNLDPVVILALIFILFLHLLSVFLVDE